jgi:hypothetical protein
MLGGLVEERYIKKKNAQIILKQLPCSQCSEEEVWDLKSRYKLPSLDKKVKEDLPEKMVFQLRCDKQA